MSRAASEASARALRPTMIVVLVALLAQFLLGMAVNLFVQIPDNHPGAHPPEYFSGALQSVSWALSDGGVWLEAHAGLGVLLGLSAIAALVLAIRSGRGPWMVATSFGLVGVVAAGFNGASFLNYHEDFSSMLMSSGFAVAMLSYLLGLFAAR